MMRSPYNQEPFGPFPNQRGVPTKIDRQTSNAVDLRGTVDFKSIFSVDSGEFAHGELVITCDATASPTVVGATNVENWPHVEVKVVVTNNGQSTTFLDAAVGSHSSATIGNDTESAGPVVVNFGLGEMPDKIDVFARARRGGVAETAGDADEVLNVICVSRLHR